MKPLTLEQVLARIAAKLEVWQVRALFLGAQASTNLRLGPHNLLDHILGPDGAMGEGTADANDNLQVLVSFWNELVTEHNDGGTHLSTMELPDLPRAADLAAFAQRRHDEIVWFVRGIDAGGDDPMEFGPDGQQILRKLGEAGGFLTSFKDMLIRTPDATGPEIVKTRRSLLELTATVEALMDDLMTVSDDVRRRALAAFESNAGRVTDDGLPARRAARVRRNDPCPCGSGRKWKRCCGGTRTVQ